MIETFELETGADGALETWDDFSFALWQMLQAFCENPPD